MKHIPNPCNCKPPQRHAYCHCAGQCAKGDAYEKYSEYRRQFNLENHLKSLMPARNVKICHSHRTGNS